MALVEFLDKALLEAIGYTKALLMIDPLYIDAFANTIDALNTKLNSTKCSINVMAILSLTDLACMAHNDGEKTLSHIMKIWKYQRQVPSSQQGDD